MLLLIDAYEEGRYKAEDGAMKSLLALRSIERHRSRVCVALSNACEWCGDNDGAVKAIKEGN